MLHRALIPCVMLVLLPLPYAAMAGTVVAGWTLSSSATDPMDNVGPASTDVLTIYLWLYCTRPSMGGVSAAKFSITCVPGHISVLSFTPSPGVLNSGSACDLDLTLTGCPPGSFLAGHFLVQPYGSGNFQLCLGPGYQGPPDNFSYGCSAPGEPQFNATMGYAAGFAKPCVSDFLFFEVCQPLVAIEDFSWGRVKALYQQ